jgi:hypothetical protein
LYFRCWNESVLDAELALLQPQLGHLGVLLGEKALVVASALLVLVRLDPAHPLATISAAPDAL